MMGNGSNVSDLESLEASEVLIVESLQDIRETNSQ